jgi:Na+/H+ antiporter
METVEVVLAMLLAVVASGYLERMLPFAVPLPLVQIVLGAVLEGVFRHGVAMEPDIFFLLFLPPLLFLDGWRIPKVGLFRDKGTIIELAFGLVVFTVVGAGFLMHWLIPAMPLPVAFALAAIVAPTDPVAVSSITARVPVPPRLMHILEGESLLNDASGLVCFRFAVAAAVTGHFSPVQAGVTFLWMVIGGLGSGVLVTIAISRTHSFLLRRVGEEDGAPILINILTPFAAYLVAEHLGASGILAAVAGGVTMSYIELSGIATPATRVRRSVVWDTLQSALNGIMFVLLGEQLPDIARGALRPSGGTPYDIWWLLGNALALGIGLVLLRFIWVWVSMRLTMFNQRRHGEQANMPRKRLVFAASMAGVRGAITMAGVMSLPLALPDGSPFPARHLAIFLAGAVIVISLVLASVALPPLLRGLQVPEEPGVEQAETEARHAAAQAAVAAVEKCNRAIGEQEDADLHAGAAEHVLNLYRHRLRGVPADGDGDGGRKAAVSRKAELDYRLAGLRAERDTVLLLARRTAISDETARKLLREIDLLEARYRQT